MVPGTNVEQSTRACGDPIGRLGLACGFGVLPPAEAEEPADSLVLTDTGLTVTVVFAVGGTNVLAGVAAAVAAA